jgi:hypothetical protein
VESLLIKCYEDHVNAIVALIESPVDEENQTVLLSKVSKFLPSLHTV